MSLTMLPTHLAGMATAGGGDDSFTAPGTESFYWPLIGGGSDWAFTRPAAQAIISVVLLGWFFVTVSSKLAIVPGKKQFYAEQVYGFVRNTIGRDVIGDKHLRPFLPLLFTLFTFVLVNNLFGIVPLVQFPTTSVIAIPIMLTAVVYVVYHVTAVRHKGGFGKYLGSLTPPGLPGWLKPIMFLLEFLTYFFIRPLTLALRLFGNMMAGHLMLLVFMLGAEYLLLHGDGIFMKFSGVMSAAMAILMTFFELLIQFLQAFIFTMLAALYISDAVSEGH